jgi:hypothetical protein
MLDRAKNEVQQKETNLINSQNLLSKWLLPEDAKIGEKIAVWYGDSLIQVTVLDGRDPEITIRTRGRKLNAA